MLPFLIRAAFLGVIFYTLSKLVRGLLRLGASARARREANRSTPQGGPEPEPEKFEFEEGQVLDVSCDEAPAAPESEEAPDPREDGDQH